MNEEQEFNYINVIPFVDIMLVLLTIILTTSTFVTTGILPISLPKVSRAETKSLKSISIDIADDGSIGLNSKPINLDNLAESIKIFAHLDVQLFFIKFDNESGRNFPFEKNIAGTS